MKQAVAAIVFTILVAMPAAVWAGGEVVIEAVSPATFKQKMDTMEGTLLDVRTPKEYQEGHLIGATNMNFFDEDFKARLEALPKEKTYFVYCRSGGRSGKTREIMRQAGFQRVYDMSGGFSQWSAEGLPSEK